MATAVTTYYPLAAMLRRMADQMLDTNGGAWANGSGDEGTLPVDVLETPDELIVQAAVPGFNENDIDVQVEKGILSIKAQARAPELPEKSRYYRRELAWQSMSRRIALPGIVDDAHVQADLKNGILTLRIPIAEQAKPRRIEVKTT